MRMHNSSDLRKADTLDRAHGTWKTVFKLNTTKPFRSRKDNVSSYTFSVTKQIYAPPIAIHVYFPPLSPLSP